jgi:hypothetical protein
MKYCAGGNAGANFGGLLITDRRANSTATDRWPSGRRRTPGKCVDGNVSWVRIPLCPPPAFPNSVSAAQPLGKMSLFLRVMRHVLSTAFAALGRKSLSPGDFSPKLMTERFRCSACKLLQRNDYFQVDFALVCKIVRLPRGTGVETEGTFTALVSHRPAELPTTSCIEQRILGSPMRRIRKESLEAKSERG